MIFFCFLFWTPKSFISPDILCHILFWCVRTAFLVWSSTMFNQAIWEHGLSLLEFWASWKFDSRGRLIHACRNMMKYVAFNRSVWFQTVLFCWFSPGLSMTKTQPAHWVVPLLSPNGCRSQLQSPQLNSWLWMVVRACFLSEGIRVRPCGAMRALLWQLTYTNQNHPKSSKIRVWLCWSSCWTCWIMAPALLFPRSLKSIWPRLGFLVPYVEAGVSSLELALLAWKIRLFNGMSSWIVRLEELANPVNLPFFCVRYPHT